jgi:hypothetical protein
MNIGDAGDIVLFFVATGEMAGEIDRFLLAPGEDCSKLSNFVTVILFLEINWRWISDN